MKNEHKNIKSEINEDACQRQVDMFVKNAPGIPVIQLWQPWASWVIEGWKTVETRTHNNFAWMLNHKVAVHACQKWDNKAIGLAKEYLTDKQIKETEEFRNLRGKILGTAFVCNYFKLTKDYSKYALIDCEHTIRYGLILENIIKVEPIKFTGAQNQLYISEAHF